MPSTQTTHWPSSPAFRSSLSPHGVVRSESRTPFSRARLSSRMGMKEAMAVAREREREQMVREKSATSWHTDALEERGGEGSDRHTTDDIGLGGEAVHIPAGELLGAGGPGVLAGVARLVVRVGSSAGGGGGAAGAIVAAPVLHGGGGAR